MAYDPVNIGTGINSGDGEPIRTAYDKINAMLSEIYDLLKSEGLPGTFLAPGTVPEAALNSNIVTNGKLADMATARLKGRKTAGTGDPEDLTVADVLEMLSIVPARGQDVGIINGGFDIWQRNTSFTAAGYTADRWVKSFTGGTVTTSRQGFTLGDALGGINPRFHARQEVSGQSSAGHFALIAQRIEGVRSFAGQTITLSFWAKRASGSGNIAIEWLQNFGTGGSPSATVTGIGVTKLTLTTEWQRFTVTVAIPSIAGKTLGSAFDDYLQFSIWTSAGTDFNARTDSLGAQTIGVDLWGFAIDRGSVAGIYRPRALADEQALCERYYEFGSSTETRWSLDVTSGQAYSVGTRFKTAKRAAPSITYANNNTGFGSPSLGSATDVGFSTSNTASATATARLISFGWTASSEL